MASVTFLPGPWSSVSPLLTFTEPLSCGVLQSPLFSCHTLSWWSHFVLWIYKDHLLPLASNIFSCPVLSSELHEESQYDVWPTKSQTYYPWELLPSENGAVPSISFSSCIPFPLSPDRAAVTPYPVSMAFSLLPLSHLNHHHFPPTVSSKWSFPLYSVHLLICSLHSL